MSYDLRAKVAATAVTPIVLIGKEKPPDSTL